MVSMEAVGDAIPRAIFSLKEFSQMKQLVAFDLDGTLAESKQPLSDWMAEAVADLLTVAHVAVISGGDWPQFEKQVASRIASRART
jgi:phosphomannomutase